VNLDTRHAGQFPNEPGIALEIGRRKLTQLALAAAQVVERPDGGP
jgi:hypothetical protein